MAAWIAVVVIVATPWPVKVAVAALLIVGVAWAVVRGLRRAQVTKRANAPPASVGELHQRALNAGGGAYLASWEDGGWVAAPPESAVLVLAGPRAGKTSCVVIPALAAHPGPAVATSTKPEVLAATLSARLSLGTAWFFDLHGHGAPAGTRTLRWSPVTRAGDWQQAQLTAEAMTGATEVDHDGAHWTERASALIASLLHAAARSGQGIAAVQGWVLRHDVDAPLAELDPGSIAHDVLSGIGRTADRERSGIFSTAARVLRAYRSPVALGASERPDFDPGQFVASHDTVYIATPASDQRLLAPLVVGLLAEIRQAAYRRAWHTGPPRPPLLLMLDECANIAPLPDLPAMLSEAGGQGVQVVVVLQDMSQARRRWPKDADGMLSLFGARVILSGVADVATLSQLSLLCGDWDRPVQTVRYAGEKVESWTTRRERQLPPDQIAQLPRGQALVMRGPHWSVLPVHPYDRHPTFAQLTQPPAPAAVQAG